MHQSSQKDLSLLCVEGQRLLGVNHNGGLQWQYDSGSNSYQSEVLSGIDLHANPFSYLTLHDYDSDGLKDIVVRSASSGSVNQIYLKHGSSGDNYRGLFDQNFPGGNACDLAWWNADRPLRGVCKVNNNLWLGNQLPVSEALTAANGTMVNFDFPVEVRRLSASGDALSVTLVDVDGKSKRKPMRMNNGKLATDERFDFAPFNDTGNFIKHVMVDWNQDQRMDLVYGYKDTLTGLTHVAVRFGSGEGFSSPQPLITWTEEDLNPGVITPRTIRVMDVIDVDGDGNFELSLYMPDADGEGPQTLITQDKTTGQWNSLPDFSFYQGYAWKPYRYGDIDGDGHKDVLQLDRVISGCEVSTDLGCGPLKGKLLSGLDFSPEWLTLQAAELSYMGFDFWDIRGDGKTQLVTRYANRSGGPEDLHNQWYGSDGQGGVTVTDLPYYIEAMVNLDNTAGLTMVNSLNPGLFARYQYDTDRGVPVIEAVRPMPEVNDGYYRQYRTFFDIDGDGDDDLITIEEKGIYWYENIGL